MSSNGEVTVSGFAKYGNVGSIEAIKPSPFLSFKINFKLLPTAQNNSALMDLDFNKNFYSFASVIYKNGELFFLVRDKKDQNLIYRTPIYVDNIWHSVEIFIFKNNVFFYLDNALIGQYIYSNKIKKSRVFISNNNTNELVSPILDLPAFIIKTALIHNGLSIIDMLESE